MVLKSIGAYAVRADDPDNPLLADSIETLNKVMALKWIGSWNPATGGAATQLREALLDEQWEQAVTLWMSLADEQVSVFPNGLEIHEGRDYPDDEFGPRLQTTALFQD